MKVKHPKFGEAFTLIEVMLSIFILSVAVLGASGYRYYAVLDAEKAAAQTEAARIALLICESWRGVGGSETYDPTAHLSSDLQISVPSSIEDYDFTSESGLGPEPQGHTLLGRYKVVSSKSTCYPTLSYKDTGTGLRVLNVVVAWPQRGHAEGGTGDNYWCPGSQTYKLFKLTTYVSD